MDNRKTCQKCGNSNQIPGRHCNNCGAYVVKDKNDISEKINLSNETLLEQNINEFLNNETSFLLDIWKRGISIQFSKHELGSLDCLITTGRELSTLELEGLSKLNFINSFDEELGINRIHRNFSLKLPNLNQELRLLSIQIFEDVFKISKDLEWRYNISTNEEQSIDYVSSDNKKPVTRINLTNLNANNNIEIQKDTFLKYAIYASIGAGFFFFPIWILTIILFIYRVLRKWN